jgi:ribonuclease P protein component
VAVVVSKKINKSAVKRNRIRRRLYQFIRLNQSKITKPYDIVINVLDDEIATLPSEQLKNTMKKVFSQTEIFEGTANSGHHGIVSKKED